jgi:hypothetical protein
MTSPHYRYTSEVIWYPDWQSNLPMKVSICYRCARKCYGKINTGNEPVVEGRVHTAKGGCRQSDQSRLFLLKAGRGSCPPLATLLSWSLTLSPSSISLVLPGHSGSELHIELFGGKDPRGLETSLKGNSTFSIGI